MFTFIISTFIYFAVVFGIGQSIGFYKPKEHNKWVGRFYTLFTITVFVWIAFLIIREETGLWN